MEHIIVQESHPVGRDEHEYIKRCTQCNDWCCIDEDLPEPCPGIRQHDDDEEDPYLKGIRERGEEES